MQITRVGVDIAKSGCNVHAVDRSGQCQCEKKLKRSNWLEELCQRVPAGAVVAMEACASAHHWARELQQRGYHLRLIAA